MPRPAASFPILSGRRAIVTGGGSAEGGVGRAIALHLAAAGAKVAVNDIDPDRAAEVAELIIQEGGSARPLVGDVSRPEVCEKLVGEVVAEFGGVDILVNNVASVHSARVLPDVDFEQWSRVIELNVRSALAMSRYAVADMVRRDGGAIVNIASIGGMLAYGSAAYGPSKAALIAMTREIALMHGREGVRANVIAPGHIHTPLLKDIITSETRERRRMIAPLGVEGDAWDIAEAALFLASDAARFISGVLLPVDGGATSIGPLAGYDLLTGN